MKCGLYIKKNLQHFFRVQEMLKTPILNLLSGLLVYEICGAPVTSC